MNKFWQVVFTTTLHTGNKTSYIISIYTENKKKLEELIESERLNYQEFYESEVDVKVAEGVYSQNFQLHYDGEPIDKNDFKILSTVVI